MKRLIFIFLILSCSLFAGSHTLFNSDTLDASPTSIVSDTVDISTYRNISFGAIYDETEVGGVSEALTIEIGVTVSSDSITWFDYDIIMDANGTDAPQASVSFTADDEDFFYLPGELVGEKLRATITGTGTDADDIVVFWLTMFYKY